MATGFHSGGPLYARSLEPSRSLSDTLRIVDRGKGSNWRHCDCWKSLLVYDGEPRKNNRAWEEAQKRAQDLRDSWDPLKVELNRLRAEEERKQVRIEAASGLCCLGFTLI